ncbi:MAG: M20/M25/M40 family metallo-hydrolase [Clostridia bacterium]|nr:M20/M25/M40 family metallo-hydrolase [Clostridia bacterium]
MTASILFAVPAAWVCVLLVRALRFTPKPEPTNVSERVDMDSDAMIRRMQRLIRLRTVSYQDKTMEDPAPFEELPRTLQELYPLLHAALQQERIGSRGLLYRWPGKSTEHPGVLMSHYDVVPAEETLWRKPPFEAALEDGVLWGRGTLDTKGTLLGILEAAELLIGEGFIPEQDLYFSFGGDEEINGNGARDIVAELERRGVTPAFVLDEGGAVVENVFPGVKRPAALIGTAEKGFVNVTFRMEGQGGHASAPPPRSPVGLLARIVARIEDHPFPFALTPPARALFDTLGRHSSFPFRLIFANLWCFAPVLNMLCKKTGGEMNALVRTTCAFTQMAGSEAPNVLPPVASVGANLRIIGGETSESVKARLENLVNDPRIHLETTNAKNPSNVSKTDGEPWQRLCDVIAATWPEAVVSPYLMVAASDSYHFARISSGVYRFSAMALSKEERGMIHGNDERVPVEKLARTVQFYVRLMRRC